jgi:hypothetical protein
MPYDLLVDDYPSEAWDGKRAVHQLVFGFTHHVMLSTGTIRTILVQGDRKGVKRFVNLIK